VSKSDVIEPVHLDGDLRELKLPAVLAHWRRLAEEAARKRKAAADYLAELAHLEVTTRRERRIQRLLAEARLPVVKTLDGFDFGAQPALDRDSVLELFRCEFVERRANVVLVGEIGTGKTHLASALVVACCQKLMRARFVTAAELVNTLAEAKSQGKLARKLEQLARFEAVCIDELGYVPFDKQGADLLFNFIARMYERRSLIVTTNLPFARWGEVFYDATAAAAVIDRIVHHATIVKTQGESYRLKDKRREMRGKKEGA
jgi:DNA replication protein DnaC